MTQIVGCILVRNEDVFVARAVRNVAASRPSAPGRPALEAEWYERGERATVEASPFIGG